MGQTTHARRAAHAKVGLLMTTTPGDGLRADARASVDKSEKSASPSGRPSKDSRSHRKKVRRKARTEAPDGVTPRRGVVDGWTTAATRPREHAPPVSSLSALEAAGAAAMLVRDGAPHQTTHALRARLSRRRAEPVARMIETRWHLLQEEAAPPARLVLTVGNAELHVMAALDARDGILVVLVPLPHRQVASELKARLTPRQHLVGALVAQGATTVEVAHALGLSVATVRRHLEAVHTRLGVRRRADLVRAFAWPDGVKRVETP